MKSFGRFVRNEYFWVVLMVVIYYLLAYGPIIYRYNNSIPGRQYLGFNTSPFDTLGNLISVQRGYSGNWFKDSYIASSLKSNLFFIRTEYILMGHIARILNIYPVNMYRLAVMTLSVVYIFTAYSIGRTIFRQKIFRLVYLFLILFGTGIIVPDLVKGWSKTGSDMQVFQRMATLQPHYMIASIGTLISLWYLAKTFDRFKIKYLLIASFAGLVTAHVFSPAIIMVFLATALYMVINLIQEKQRHTFIKRIPYVSVFVILSSIPAIYLFSLRNQFDLNVFKYSEYVANPGLDLPSYLMIVGLIIIPVVLAVRPIFKSGDIFLAMIISYIFVHPFAVLFISGFLGINRIRFIQTPYFLLFGLAGTYGIKYLNDILYSKIKLIGTRISVIVFMILMIFSSIYTYQFSLEYFSSQKSWDFYDLGYPYKFETEAMEYIYKSGIKNKIFLTDMISGTLLQALTPNKSYITIWVQSMTPEGLNHPIIEPMRRLYKGEMSEPDMREFLEGNNISYIFFGNIERTHLYYAGKGDELKYPFLKEIYRNTGAIIYEFKNI